MPGGQDAASELLNKLWCEGQGNVETLNSAAGASATNQITDPAVFSYTALTLVAATPVIKLPAPAVGKKKVLLVIQDATGSRVPSFTSVSGAIRWVGSAAPTLTTAATKIDKITFECVDGVNWIGQAALNIG